MAPIPIWSGNLRLSLVLVPVRMFPATSTEGTIAFRMIHEPSGKPIKYLKGIETERGFEEVPEEEIIKGYEHTKGHHVLIKPEELDELKLEAKHTIDMARFVDQDEIDSRYFEKPYYLLPDGDSADEGYVVLRDALAKNKKIAIGQLIMHGREHLVGITAHKKGLVLAILRYQDELRKPESFFDNIDTKADDDAVKLAVDLIQQESGKFEPQNMPNEYARAVHELVQAKIEQRAPEVEIETEKRDTPKVVNIMDALKKSMQARGQTKVRDAVRRRVGESPRLRSPRGHQRVPNRQLALGDQCLSGCYIRLGRSRRPSNTRAYRQLPELSWASSMPR
jgi:DNA end-binding protein Ku